MENLQASSSQLQLNQEQSSEITGSKLLPTNMSFEVSSLLFSPHHVLRWWNLTAEVCYPWHLHEGLSVFPAGQGALLPGAQCLEPALCHVTQSVPGMLGKLIRVSQVRALPAGGQGAHGLFSRAKPACRPHTQPRANCPSSTHCSIHICPNSCSHSLKPANT